MQALITESSTVAVISNVNCFIPLHRKLLHCRGHHVILSGRTRQTLTHEVSIKSREHVFVNNIPEQVLTRNMSKCTAAI